VIDWGIVARAVHIAAIVVWIGGVWLVTMVLLPGMKQKPSDNWIREFNAIERRFAPQARIAVLLVVLSGLYMLYAYDLWDRFAQSDYWWMHLMVAIWVLFAALLFVIEPLAPKGSFHRRATAKPTATLARIIWVHRVLLLLSMAAIFAAVCGSRGLF
jgi:uncharacterized membrane protein